MRDVSNLSLIFAGAGWAFGLLIFALIQFSGATELHNAVQQTTPALCGCILPIVWVVGVVAGMNNALSFARAGSRVPRSSIAGLLLCLLGLAATMTYMLLTLIAA